MAHPFTGEWVERKMGNLYGRTRDIAWESEGARLRGMWFVYALAAPVFWALSNVLDSFLVRRYGEHPAVLMWCQSLFSLIALCTVALFFDVRSGWMVLLFLVGAFSYAGVFLYFRVLNHVDASVMNASWALLSVFLSAAGILIFHEVWTVMQSIGVVLILGGVLFLAFWHKHLSWFRTIFWLSAIAVLLVPLDITLKASLLAWQSVIAVFFWMRLGRDVFAFLFPLFVPGLRRSIMSLSTRVCSSFFLVSAVAVYAMLTGVYLVTKAYEAGYLSLVSPVENTQPFFTLFFAWVIARTIPQYAPRELLTAQSVQVKLVSFMVVFAGLAMLAVG